MSELTKEELLEWVNIRIENNKCMDCEKIFQQIKEMIQKPGVTEEWYEEKAQKMKKITATLFRKTGTMNYPIGRCRDFIREIAEEIHGRKED